jgi:hypothetical protein
MTLTNNDGPNGPAAFDFGLGSHGATPDGSPQPTRRSARRATVDSRSLAVPLAVAVLVALLVGGASFTGWYLVTTSEDQVKADSAQFCAGIAEAPGALTQTGFGWPTDGADLATTLELMKTYQARWQAIAQASPPTIKPDATAVASAAASIIAGIETSKSIDRPTTLAKMDAVTSKTAIPAWAGKYCD